MTGRPADALDTQRQLVQWWSSHDGLRWGEAWLGGLANRLGRLSDELQALHDDAATYVRIVERYRDEAVAAGVADLEDDDPAGAELLERMHAELAAAGVDDKADRQARSDALDAQYRALCVEHLDVADSNEAAANLWLTRRIDALRRAQTYWIAEPMATLVDAAYASMPEHQLRPEDVPAGEGFMLVDGHALLLGLSSGEERPLGFTAVSWETVTGETLKKEQLPGIRITWWFDITSHPDRQQDVLRALHARLIPHSIFWPFGDPEPPAAVGFEEQHGCRWLLSAWHMMMRPLAAVERPVVERATRKRAAREGLAPDVSVVTLRHQSVKSGAPARKVDWQARWLVRGFWRKQWYPSLQEHRPIWIDEYVKGPEDRPLRITPRVYAWRR